MTDKIKKESVRLGNIVSDNNVLTGRIVEMKLHEINGGLVVVECNGCLNTIPAEQLYGTPITPERLGKAGFMEIKSDDPELISYETDLAFRISYSKRKGEYYISSSLPKTLWKEIKYMSTLQNFYFFSFDEELKIK